MEVIVGPMLASQPCLHAFWGFDIPTYSFIVIYSIVFFFWMHMVWIYSFIVIYSIVFFSECIWCEYIFEDCRNTIYYYEIMKSYNHKCIKICSSVFCIYVLIIILLHLQMMYILYFTCSTVCHSTRSSVNHCVNHSVLQWLS